MTTAVEAQQEAMEQEIALEYSFTFAVEDKEDPNTWRIDPTYKGETIVMDDTAIAECRKVRAHIEYESGLFGVTTRRAWLYHSNAHGGPLLRLSDAKSVGVE